MRSLPCAARRAFVSSTTRVSRRRDAALVGAPRWRAERHAPHELAPFQEQRKLGCRPLENAATLLLPRRSEAPLRKALRQDAKSGAIPEEHLCSAAVPTDEQVNCALENITTEVLAHACIAPPSRDQNRGSKSSNSSMRRRPSDRDDPASEEVAENAQRLVAGHPAGVEDHVEARHVVHVNQEETGSMIEVQRHPLIRGHLEDRHAGETAQTRSVLVGQLASTGSDDRSNFVVWVRCKEGFRHRQRRLVVFRREEPAEFGEHCLLDVPRMRGRSLTLRPKLHDLGGSRARPIRWGSARSAARADCRCSRGSYPLRSWTRRTLRSRRHLYCLDRTARSRSGRAFECFSSANVQSHRPGNLTLSLGQKPRSVHDLDVRCCSGQDDEPSYARRGEDASRRPSSRRRSTPGRARHDSFGGAVGERLRLRLPGCRAWRCRGGCGHASLK